MRTVIEKLISAGFLLTALSAAAAISQAQTEKEATPTIVVRGRVHIEGLSAYPFLSEKSAGSDDSLSSRTPVENQPDQRFRTLLSARMVDRDLKTPIPGLLLKIEASCKPKPRKSFQVTTNSSGRWTLSLPFCDNLMDVRLELPPSAPYILSGKSNYEISGGRSNVSFEVDAPSSVPFGNGIFSVRVKATRDLETETDTVDRAQVIEKSKLKRVPVTDRPIFLESSDGSIKTSQRTDSNGEALFDLRSNELENPGRVDFTVRMQASKILNPALHSFGVLFYTLPVVTLAADKKSAPANESVVLKGLVTETKKPLSGVRVSIRAHGVTVAEATTDGEGRYYTKLDMSKLPKGKTVLRARTVQDISWRRSALSAPTEIMVEAVTPLPTKYFLFPILFTALLTAVFIVVRRKPWKRWVTALKRREERTSKQGVKMGKVQLSSFLGRGLHTIKGRVVDAGDDKPIGDVEILVFSKKMNKKTQEPLKLLRADSNGEFGSFELATGDYLLSFRSEKHLQKRIEITLPHRGKLCGFLVRLVSVRDEVMRVYLAEVEKWLEKRSLVGILTPREVLDRITWKWQKLKKEGNQEHRRAVYLVTDLVENAVYSPRTPNEDVVRVLHSLLDALAEDLNIENKSGDAGLKDETGPFTVDSGSVPKPLTPKGVLNERE